MWRNNWVQYAVREARCLSDEDRLAYVLSLGTGSCEEERPPGLVLFLGRLADGLGLFQGRVASYLGLLVDYINAQMSGSSSWQELVQDNDQLHSQGRLHRWDVKFRGSQPGIDAVHQTERIIQETRDQIRCSHLVPLLSDEMIQGFFHFELTSPPEGVYRPQLTGHVTCRWKKSQLGFEAFRACVRKHHVQVIVQDVCYGEIGEDKQGNLTCVVDSLNLLHREERVSIQVQLGDGPRRHINNSPTTLAELTEAKGFHTSLGVAEDHGTKRPWEEREDCFPRKKVKLAAPEDEMIETGATMDVDHETANNLVSSSTPHSCPSALSTVASRVRARLRVRSSRHTTCMG